MSDIEHSSDTDEAGDDLDGARPKKPWWARFWFLALAMFALGIVIVNVFHTPGTTTFGALVLGAIIFKTGWFFLQSFATPLPPPPDPGLLRKVKLVYRCQVCGTEVRMTAATDEDPEPPRHCMDEMALITPIE